MGKKGGCECVLQIGRTPEMGKMVRFSLIELNGLWGALLSGRKQRVWCGFKMDATSDELEAPHKVKE